MKINGNKPPQSRGPERAAPNTKNIASTDGAEKAAPASKTGPAPANKVELSGKSKELAAIVAAVNQLPEIREEKVQEVKQAVDNGTYKIDPRKVAEGILKEM